MSTRLKEIRDNGDGTITATYIDTVPVYQEYQYYGPNGIMTDRAHIGYRGEEREVRVVDPGEVSAIIQSTRD